MFLIIGASGFIGNKLYNYFKGKGVAVKGTYYSRTFEGAEKEGIYLDLGNPDFLNILSMKDLTHIFLCHGVTNIDECKTNRSSSYKINVTNTIKLLEGFRHTGVIPINLSTDMVYSGSQQNCTESDIPAPVTEYGRQKVEVENYIATQFSKYIILRLSKVYGIEKGDQTLFASWLDSLTERKTILAAADIFISPIYVMDVVHALDGLVTGKHYGIFNLGGHETATRYEFSQRLARFFKYDLSLIEKKSINDFGFIEPRPLYSNLSSAKAIEATGIKLTSVEDCFKLMGKHINNMEISATQGSVKR
ncbi:SDR family oxidoreductase [Chloroflexota bacterium]